MQDRLMDELKKTILAVKFKKLGPFAFSIVLLGDLKSSHQSEILHSLIFCAIDPSYNIFTARKQSLRRLCFYACLSFCSGGGGLLHFMLGCTPLDQRQASPPGSRHPLPQRSACWEIRTTNGRYASYWKAVLSVFTFCVYVCVAGTGKTLVARALANECSTGDRKVAFFMRKGADCLSKWVGESERQLRLLFDQVCFIWSVLVVRLFLGKRLKLYLKVHF